MDFFKKNGRPTKEEKDIIDRLSRIISEKNIPLGIIPTATDIDGLVAIQDFISNYEDSNINLKNQETLHSDEELDIIEDNINEVANEQEELLLDEEVLASKKYNEFSETDNEQSPAQEDENEALEQPESIEGIETIEFEEYDPFAEELIERSYNKVDEAEIIHDDNDLSEAKIEPSKEDTQISKRKLAEKTADLILNNYARFAPMPFKRWAKFNEEEIDRLAFKGKLDTRIEIAPGTSFSEHVEKTNSSIDEIFEVSEETKNEIKDPLIDVLIENEMELTPTQRLMIALFGHLSEMTATAYQLSSQNKKVLNYLKAQSKANNLRYGT